MVTLHILRQSLNNPVPLSSEEPKNFEEHFDQIVTFIEQEKIPEAIRLIEKSFAKGIPDIRLMVYYFYAHFFSYGIKSFIEVFPLIITLVNEHWENLRPLNRKEKQVESSLNWFFSLTINKLRYGEKLYKAGKLHPIWEKSIQQTSAKELEKLMAACVEFKNFFFEKWPHSPLKERLLNLLKRIEELGSLISFQTVEQEESCAEPDDQKFSSIEQIDGEQSSVAAGEEVGMGASAEEGTETRGERPPEDPLFFKVAPTSEMDIFLKRLKTFELLIEKGDYVKASLVAKDIHYRMENFNPVVYLPQLFSNYFFLMAKHAPALSQQEEDSSPLQLEYLEKLYQTDLDRFLEW